MSTGTLPGLQAQAGSPCLRQAFTVERKVAPFPLQGPAPEPGCTAASEDRHPLVASARAHAERGQSHLYEDKEGAPLTAAGVLKHQWSMAGT